MAAWRSLGVVALALALTQSSRAQTYPLTETVQVDDCFRIQLDMKLSGEIRVSRDDRAVPLKLTATASHKFPERVLLIDNGLPQKMARVYETAQSIITLDGNRSERTLRPERTLMVTQCYKDQALSYCPTGPLTRDELDLTEHFDTLNLVGLLPGKAVAVSDTWKVGNGVVLALCNFEGLTAHDLAGKLEAVKNNEARFSIKGTATGINLGALAKLTITATGIFDLGQKRLTALEWQQKEERDQGPVSPAATVESSTMLTRALIEEPKCLDDVSLVSVPEGLEPALTFTQLYHRDPRDGFDLGYGREWHIVAATEEHMVMRLMDRGDFVAQVTITPWKRAEPGKHMTGEEFQDEMAETPGWKQEQVLQVGELPLDGGRWGYRISALGQMEDLKVMQNFYLVAGPQGEQVVLLFTLKQAMVDKLGTRDLSLVGSLDFPSNHKGEPEKPKQP